MDKQQDTDRFFTMAQTYDKMCKFLVPHYDLLQDDVFNIVDVGQNKEITVIDLGAGSGIFIEKFLLKFPLSKCVWIDYSDDFLKSAKIRLGKFNDRVQYILCNIEDKWEGKLNCKADIIVSMSAIHHLDAEGKKEIYNKCFDILNENGWFFNIDEMKTGYDDSYIDELNFWYDYVLKKGNEFTGEMKVYYEKWRDHFDRWKARNIDNIDRKKVKGDDMHDYYISQLEWLKEIGFGRVNLFYKYHLWCLIGGKKSALNDKKI